MARIVMGMALSHTPQLHTPAEQWEVRLAADIANPHHYFRGGTYTWSELLELRRPEQIGRWITPEEKSARLARANAAVSTLAAHYRRIAPDVAVIIGNDQHELFVEDVMPALTIFCSKEMANRPATREQAARMPAGIHLAEAGHAPPVELVHPGCPELANHLVEQAIDAHFDVARSQWLPQADQRISFCSGIPHAFGFIYRNIMKDEVIPNVPVILNTFYAPNQPRVARCFGFGRMLGRAIRSWRSDLRVAVFGSGGLSHFAVDEAFDRAFLDAILRGDHDALLAIDEAHFRAGTSECKNWITVLGMLSETTLKPQLTDYVACYRSPGGTGTGTGFMLWE